MITIKEQLISLADAAKLRSLPPRRGGKRTHKSCLYRWSTNGCRGVVLETIQVGGTRCTSIEALGRFFAALTAQTMGSGEPDLSSERQRSIARAERELDDAGI